MWFSKSWSYLAYASVWAAKIGCHGWGGTNRLILVLRLGEFLPRASKRDPVAQYRQSLRPNFTCHLVLAGNRESLVLRQKITVQNSLREGFGNKIITNNPIHEVRNSYLGLWLFIAYRKALGFRPAVCCMFRVSWPCRSCKRLYACSSTGVSEVNDPSGEPYIM